MTTLIFIILNLHAVNIVLHFSDQRFNGRWWSFALVPVAYIKEFMQFFPTRDTGYPSAASASPFCTSSIFLAGIWLKNHIFQRSIVHVMDFKHDSADATRWPGEHRLKAKGGSRNHTLPFTKRMLFHLSYPGKISIT